MDQRPPLFRFDPGWLWIAAGLVIVFVATVVPAQRALEEDRTDLRRLQSAESRVYRLLEAHDRFLADLRDGNESLLRRLAAANLNRMPAGDEAVMLADSIDRHPIAWIESSVPIETEPSPAVGRSLLELLVSGQGGLWMTGAGILCLFVGLMLGPGPLVVRDSSSQADDAEPDGDTDYESVTETGKASDSEAARLRWAPVAAATAFAGGETTSTATTDEDVVVAPLLWEPESREDGLVEDVDDVEDLEAEADEEGELEDAVEEEGDAELEDEAAELDDESEEDLDAEADEEGELEDAVEEEGDAELEDAVEEEEDAELEDEAAELEDESEEDLEAEADEEGELEDAVEEEDAELEDEAAELEDASGPEIEVHDFSIDRSECDEFSREAWESSEFDVRERG